MTKDVELSSADPSRRSLRRMVGPFLVIAVDIGYSDLVAGKFWGRIDVPGDPSGYVYVKVDLLGKNLVFGCVQLA